MFERLADRLGVSVNVIYLGLAGIVIALAAYLYLRSRNTTPATTTSTTAGVISNGPASSGADNTSANPNPTSPNGGADTGTTPAATVTVPAANTTPVHPATAPVAATIQNAVKQVAGIFNPKGTTATSGTPMGPSGSHVAPAKERITSQPKEAQTITQKSVIAPASVLSVSQHSNVVLSRLANLGY